MNPETKLSRDDIKKICSKHNINLNKSERITVGFSHEVHKINDNLILKAYRRDSYKKFLTELAILSSTQDFPKPKLIASSTGKIDYIIMSFVKGCNLGSSWHTASNTQRKLVIKDLSDILRKINKLDPTILPNPEGDTWVKILTNRVNKLSEELLNKNIISRSEYYSVIRKFKSYEDLFIGDRLYPVNWDIHFDNLIVNKNNKIQAIIDLENVMMASLDYPLVGIEEMVREPHRYMAEENEKYANTEDYSKILDWYKLYYPEMFKFNNLKKRVEAYQFINILHLMQEWSHNPELRAKLNKYLK
jgi:aminoglycoside phosphotransferase (APT) family kinase protein